VVNKVDTVRIRSYPKAVFLYPSFVAAIACAILAYALLGKEHGEYSKLPGNIFFTVFAVNIMITAWDFSKAGFVTVILLGVIGILAGVLIEMKFDFLHDVQKFLEVIQLRCHPHVFLVLAAIFGAMLALSFLQSRLDYWEIHGDEILHVTGFVGNVERFPAPNLRFKKELPDVFEYALLGSGTIVLQPVQGERHALTNVIGVNGVERRIEALLSTIDVTVEKPAPRPDAPTT
jgi:hypothetical protein